MNFRFSADSCQASLRAIVALLLLAAFEAITVQAQEITGTILGTIADNLGAVIPNARVVIKDIAKDAVVRELATDPFGQYAAPRLPAGLYRVIVDAPGFATAVTQIALGVSDRSTVNLTLAPKAVQQQITVKNSGLQVPLSSAGQESLVSGIQVRQLPLNNRNSVQLVALAPGVVSGIPDQLYIGTTNPNTGQLNSANFSINGARSSQNSWTVDGVDNIDRGSSQRLLTYPSVDAIQEFKVLQGISDAEYGKASGGFINVVTRTGTSSLHGSLYEFFRNDVLSANNFFNNRFGIKRPPLRYNNFGWTLGGPVPVYRSERNKTFFFFAQEFRRVIASNTIASVVPTAAEKAGVFAKPVCVAFASNICTATATQIPVLNPVAVAYVTDLWSKIPEPQDPVSHQLFSVQQSIANHRQELARIDQMFGSRFAVFARYLHDSLPTQEPGGVFGSTPLPLVGTTQTDSPGQSWAVRSTLGLSQESLLEVGYSYSYGAVFSRPIGLVASENAPHVNVPLPFPSSLTRVPRLTFSNVLSNVTGFGPYQQSNRNHAVMGTLSTVRGSHTLKTGASYNFYRKRENAGNLNAGSFRFSSAGLPATGTPIEQTWANFLLGNAVSFTQTSVDIEPSLRAHQFEWFVQDEVRWLRNVSLSLGLRLSYFRQPSESSGRLSNFDPTRYDPNSAPTINPADGNVVPGTGDALNGIIVQSLNSPFGSKISNENNLNYAPRIGLVWDPTGNGKTAVRTGYGIFFDSNIFGIYQDSVFVNPPYVQNIVITNTRLEDPAGGAVTNSPLVLRASPLPNHTPYLQTWELDVQHEIASDLIGSIGYSGHKGTHLLGGLNINQPLPGAYVSALPQLSGSFITAETTPLLNAIRPYRGYGAINAIETIFNSNYNALQASLRKRFRDEGLINVSYTFGKALTDAQTDRSTAPQNTYDIAAEYGPSQLDRKHVLTANFLYSLPWYQSQLGVAGHLFGGWELSGILIFNSGLPLTVTSTRFDPAGLGLLDGNSLAVPRPDAIDDPNASAPHQVDRWFDVSAFAEVPSGHYRPGNARRGSVHGPGYSRVDLAILKNTRLTEQLRLQFRAETFNVLNHTNFDAVNTAFGTSSFGRVTSTRDPRLIQLGLKVSF
jgi:hypothetical protein